MQQLEAVSIFYSKRSVFYGAFVKSTVNIADAALKVNNKQIKDYPSPIPIASIN